MEALGGGGERERESEREGMRESVGGLKLKSVGLKDMRWEERKRDYRREQPDTISRRHQSH